MTHISPYDEVYNLFREWASGADHIVEATRYSPYQLSTNFAAAAISTIAKTRWRP